MLTSWQEITRVLAAKQVELSADAKLVQDSRQLRLGDVFVAIVGHAMDGAAFVSQVIEKKASVILVSSRCDKSLYQDLSLGDTLLFVIHELETNLPALAKAFYLTQDKPLPLVAVTGTNGKTSITHLLAQLSQAARSQEVAVIGTMGTGSIYDLQTSANTTPGVCDVYRLIKSFQQDAEHAFNSVAMEVSSHALEQNRVEGLEFDVAIFTNLTLDHLDYHQTMEQYFAAKAKLFTEYAPKYAVVNADDEYGRRILENTSEQTRLVAYGQSDYVKQNNHYVYIATISNELDGLVVQLESNIFGRTSNIKLKLPVYGEFNCLNLAAVFATAQILNWPIKSDHFSCLKSVPGRLELFTAAELPVAIVDYAHTPDALEQSLLAVRSHLKGRLTVIFGCGGDRDASKRPIMAEIAERLADIVIVTNDNPRTETPSDIVEDIRKGFKRPERHRVIYDRKEAIRQALIASSSRDAVLIAGKGHETYQIIGQDMLDYDERKFTADTMAVLSKQIKESLGSEK